MPQVNHTLPPLVDFLQPELHLVNNANATTVTYTASGADLILNQTSISIAPFESLTLYPAAVANAWRFRAFSRMAAAQLHADDGTNPVLGLNTPIPLGPDQSTPLVGTSQHFSVNASGQLVAVRPLNGVSISYSVRWTATGTNSDFDIEFDWQVVSGVATIFQIAADDQASRTDSVTKTSSSNAIVDADEGAVIELEGSSLGSMAVTVDGVLANIVQGST